MPPAVGIVWFKVEKTSQSGGRCHLALSDTRFSFPLNRMAPKIAVIPDLSRADNALAHRISIELRRAIRREQVARSTTMVDLAPFSLGAFSTWNSLRKVRVLRLQERCPVSCTVMSSLQEQACQIIGMTCLNEVSLLAAGLTVDELSQAAEVRSMMIIELQHLPVWLESRIDLVPANMRPVMARYLNALAETTWELSNLVHDLALTELASRAAEACVRCNFRRAASSEIVALTPPRVATPSSLGHRSLSLAYGLISQAGRSSATTHMMPSSGSMSAPASLVPHPPRSDGHESSSDDWIMSDDDQATQ